MIEKPGKPNRQVERTKSWIFDAIMILMDDKPYTKITISDITKKAGIARTTFYYNYNDIDDVIFEYLRNSIHTELLTSGAAKKDNKPDTIVLVFDLNYMIKHQKNIKKILSVADIENRILRESQEWPMSLVESYRKKLSKEEYLICRYKICYQITGCLRVLFDWFMNDMPAPAETVASMLDAMNIPRTVQLRNIPSIVVRIK